MINIDIVYEQIPKEGGVSVNGIRRKLIDKKIALEGDHTLYPSISAKVRSLRKSRLIKVSHILKNEIYFIRRQRYDGQAC